MKKIVKEKRVKKIVASRGDKGVGRPSLGKNRVQKTIKIDEAYLEPMDKLVTDMQPEFPERVGHSDVINAALSGLMAVRGIDVPEEQDYAKFLD
jgi:hypothetical protein